MALQKAQTSCLEVAFYEHGSPNGWPVVLSHGFPYDPQAYDKVYPRLVAAGARVLIPYLRGFGPTRFLSPTTLRSGQQAALARDIIELLDARQIPQAILAGFDWGGLASCAASLLWPERVAGLVSYGGYDVIDLSAQKQPGTPALERAMWYQHLLQHDRGKNCLSEHRRDFTFRLWQEWSPSWELTMQKDTFGLMAPSFDNPDFVDVVAHHYRFALGTAPGDPSLASLESKLAMKPRISVPSITLDGKEDPLKPGGSSSHDHLFSSPHERREYNVGHAFPLEHPAAFADAVITVHDWACELEGR